MNFTMRYNTFFILLICCLAVLSGRAQESDQQRPTLLAINQEHIVDGKLEDYTSTYAKLKAALRAGGADLYWQSTLVSDSVLLNYIPIERMADLDKLEEKMSKRTEQVAAAELASLYQRFAYASDGMQRMVVRLHDDKSYWGDYDPETFDHFRFTEYRFAPKDHNTVFEMTTELRDMLAEKESKLPFAIYTYEMGGPSNQLIVIDYGTDRADLERRIADEDRLIAGAEFDDIRARLMQHIEPIMRSFGRDAPEFAYLPKE